LRTIDVGVAAGYAIVCITLIAALSPYSADGEGAGASADGRASLAVAGYIRSVGVSFLSSDPPSTVCSSLGSYSNSTFAFGGSVDGVVCGRAPSYFLGSSSFIIGRPAGQIEVEAWVVGA
jgi:hypothetical protein